MKKILTISLLAFGCNQSPEAIKSQSADTSTPMPPCGFGPITQTTYIGRIAVGTDSSDTLLIPQVAGAVAVNVNAFELLTNAPIPSDGVEIEQTDSTGFLLSGVSVDPQGAAWFPLEPGATLFHIFNLSKTPVVVNINLGS